jgi:hypothetical protein
MNTFAVITGDIVSSTSIKNENREQLLKSLKVSFQEINKTFLKETKSPFEIFRGDSFQSVIKKPELSLLISFLIRAKLRSIGINKEEKKHSIKENWDARIAIGIGSIGFSTKKTIESDGQAFQFSGTTLDRIKKTEHRLKIQTPWQDVNSELEVSFSFADAIVSEWSIFQAEAFYLYLLQNETQKTLAELLNISQPSLRKRLVTGKIESIDLLRKRFENLISTKL